MALRLSFDTTFLIDLQRERLKEEAGGPAHRFLAGSPDAELFLSAVALAEFAEGFASVEHPVVRAVRDQHTVLLVDEQTALVYAGLVRGLRDGGRLIGTNDAWIGSTSLRYGLPLVTANVEHFQRVDGLEVVEYAGERDSE